VWLGAKGECSFGFWFLVCYAATQLAIQFQQECIQVVFFESIVFIENG